MSSGKPGLAAIRSGTIFRDRVNAQLEEIWWIERASAMATTAAGYR
jgi:hypothetical protein